MKGSNKFWSIVYSIVLILQALYGLQHHDVGDQLFSNIMFLHVGISSILFIFYLFDSIEGCVMFTSDNFPLYRIILVANIAIFFVGVIFLIKVSKKLNNILNKWADDKL